MRQRNRYELSRLRQGRRDRPLRETADRCRIGTGRADCDERDEPEQDEGVAEGDHVVVSPLGIC
jgi:hypothetical protein